MKFQKNNTLGGRTKGSTNKVNQPIREKFLELLESNLDQMQSDLDSLEPKDRLKLIIDIAAYCIPKLKATEITEVTTEPRELELTIEELDEFKKDFFKNY